jgi:hypothetical protein
MDIIKIKGLVSYRTEINQKYFEIQQKKNYEIMKRNAIVQQNRPSLVTGNGQEKPISNKEFRDIKILDIFSTKFIENIIRSLEKILTNCGIVVNVFIRNICNDDIIASTRDKNRYMFICCPQTLLQCANGPVYPAKLLELPSNKYFLYQLEQLDLNNKKNLNQNIINLISKSKHTFDYSDTNINYYPTEIKYKISKLIPPIVESSNFTYKDIIKASKKFRQDGIQDEDGIQYEDKEIDVFFCGHINERRDTIIKYLKEYGINVTVKQDVFGEELTTLISKSKIFINIKTNNASDVLESCRLHEALMSTNTHIVSEPVKVSKEMELYKERVIFTDDFMNTIKVLLSKKGVIDYRGWLNYSKITHLTETELFIQLDKEYDNKKLLHRYQCFSNLDLIKNIIIPTINVGDIKETVLIEFRPMPHLDFLIRNTIIKFPKWSHTVVCGNLNYVLLKNICEQISKNITIINLDIDNLTPSDYSKLLTNKDFWLQFKGEKILLYQEDTMLFHNRIEEFMQYDYIGASWAIGQEDNLFGVGNGGFSLRSKSKMIECINTVNSCDLKLGQSTVGYMKATNSNFIPEDVYFSKTLIDYKLGKVALRNVANRFSQETQLCINPLGGHNFWLAENSKLKIGFTLK